MTTTKTFGAVGLDAGSTWTRCVVCALEEGRLRFLGYAKTASQGWKKGRIFDQGAAAGSMLKALREAQHAAQAPVGSAVVGVGANVRGHNGRRTLDLGGPRKVTQRDVNHAMERAAHVQLPDDRKVLHMLPQDFVVDGHPGHRDPRGMVAAELVANVYLVTTSEHEHDCLVDAVNQAHVSVEETVYEALAACYAAVLPEERRQGVALLSVGAHSTELIVYYGDTAHLAMSFPISGDHFTRDVARGLSISFEDAVHIKHEFGCARAESTPENSVVEVPSRGNRDVPRRTLNRILEARAEELFGYVQRELARVGMQGALAGGLFLAGGGARLDGMCDLAERTLQCEARNALPTGIQDWPDEINDPTWTTAAGLAMYSAKLNSQGEATRRAQGLLGRIAK